MNFITNAIYATNTTNTTNATNDNDYKYGDISLYLLGLSTLGYILNTKKQKKISEKKINISEKKIKIPKKEDKKTFEILYLIDSEGNEFIYDGEMKNNEPHGTGTGIWGATDYCKNLLIDKGIVGLEESIIEAPIIYDEEKKANYILFNHIYRGEWKNGKQYGNGILIESDGSTYDGEWEDNVLCGEVNCTIWSPAVTYTYWSKFPFVKMEIACSWYKGDIRGNGSRKLHGNGSMTWLNNDEYKGEFKDGKRCGRGIYTWWESCTKYNGMWENGKFHGHGKLTATCDEYYVGVFFNGKKEGKGIMVYANGDNYEGEWGNDMYHGFGIKIWENRSKPSLGVRKYEGNWLQHEMCGYGKYIWDDDSYWEGQWEQNNRIQGKMYWVGENRTYEGTYKHGVEHIGIMKWGDGQQYDGTWKHRLRCGRGKHTNVDGSYYEGEWRDDKKNGKGIFTYVDDSYYDGEWRDDKKNGKGIFKYVNGSYYEGEWLDDKKNGEGILTFPLVGITYKGKWKNDKKYDLFIVRNTKGLNVKHIYFKDDVQDIKKTNRMRQIKELTDEKCSICTSEIIHNISITECGHFFHSACILKWSCKHNSCPLCRSKLF